MDVPQKKVAQFLFTSLIPCMQNIEASARDPYERRDTLPVNGMQILSNWPIESETLPPLK